VPGRGANAASGGVQSHERIEIACVDSINDRFQDLLWCFFSGHDGLLSLRLRASVSDTASDRHGRMVCDSFDEARSGVR
jgi:hypothetical protein